VSNDSATPAATPAAGTASGAIESLFGVAGKVAVVTGGSRGIGAMIAEGLVRAGCRVYITARKAEACDAKAAELSAYGYCVSAPGDLSTDEGVRQFTEMLSQREDRLDILVNNAGATWGAPLEQYPLSAFDKVWNINVKAPFNLIVRCLPLLRAAATAEDPARIINIGSIDGLTTSAVQHYAYSSSKAGVHMLTQHLARELAPESITVNALAPGPFESKMMAWALDDPQARAGIEAHTPLGRIGHPDDVAGAAIYLSSRAGRYLTGVVIPVDGGITIGGGR
jgi:NAD(P)-dependent dehydrogenase (short-subunit alcohol dehydrogenase family)